MRLVKLVSDEARVREGEEELEKVRAAAEANEAGRKVDDYIHVELEALVGGRCT